MVDLLHLNNINLILLGVIATTDETERIFLVMTGIYKITNPNGKIYIAKEAGEALGIKTSAVYYFLSVDSNSFKYV